MTIKQCSCQTPDQHDSQSHCSWQTVCKLGLGAAVWNSATLCNQLKTKLQPAPRVTIWRCCWEYRCGKFCSHACWCQWFPTPAFPMQSTSPQICATPCELFTKCVSGQILWTAWSHVSYQQTLLSQSAILHNITLCTTCHSKMMNLDLMDLLK